jgi:transcriptional regulator with XRE-family HTH domain
MRIEEILKQSRKERGLNLRIKVKANYECPNDIARFIGTRRLKRNLTVRELSQLAGVHYLDAWRLENGKHRNRQSILKKVCEALKCEIPEEFLQPLKLHQLSAFETSVIGEIIRNKRLSMELSQEAFAELLKVSSGTISHTETRRSDPSPSLRKKLETLLNCELPVS